MGEMDLCRKGLGSQNFIFKDPVETKAKNGKFLSLFLKCHSGSSNTNIIIITARSRKAIQEPGRDGAHLSREAEASGFFEFKASLVKTG